MHQQFMEALRYQLGKRTKNISDIMKEILAVMNQLVQLSEGLRSTMEWFRRMWRRTRLSPLYAEIFDIPQNTAGIQVATHIPSEFQNASYAPMQHNPLYGVGPTVCVTPKTPQTMLHYHQYPNFQPLQDQFTLYNVQNSAYANVADYTDESHHHQQHHQQPFLYASGHERWHNSAFEPYTTDMPSTAQRLESDRVLDISKDENASTSTYAESHVRSRSHSSTTSPGFASIDTGQNSSYNNGNSRPPHLPLINSVMDATDFTGGISNVLTRGGFSSMDNNAIVSGDDPFAAFQNVDIPIRSRDNGTQSVFETDTKHDHSSWADLSDLNGLKKDESDLKSEMPTLIPAPDILREMDQKSTLETFESVSARTVECGEVLPVENRNGS